MATKTSPAAAILIVAFCAFVGAQSGAAEEVRPIRWIRFVSDAPVDEPSLRGLLPFEPGQAVTDSDIAEARRRLDAKGIFQLVQSTVVPEGDGVGVVFDLQRKWIIDKVRVHRGEAISAREAYRLVRLETGMLFDPELVTAAAERIEKRCREQGYVDTRVEVIPTLRPGEIDLDFHVHEGMPLVVAAVVVQGDTGLPREKLEHELRKLVGKNHTRGQLREAERTVVRLLRRNEYYEARAAGSWQPASGNEGVVWLQVEAGPRYRIEISGNEKKSDAKLLALIDLEKRLIVTDGTWRELGRRMERAYREAGYPNAQVSLEMGEEAPRTVKFDVSEGERYLIRRVVFQGNDTIPADDLQRAVLTQPRRCLFWGRVRAFRRGALLDDFVDGDRERIELLYRKQGFESAQVYEVVRWFDEEEQEISVVFFIDEGPRTIVAEVRREGLSELGEKLPEFEVHEGDPLDGDAVERDRERVIRAFRRLGYTGAEAEVTVERAEGDDRVDAQVVLGVRPGPRRDIGAVIVQDNVDTRDRVVLRELPFRSGDALDSEALIEGQTKVQRLGLFRSVSVQALGPEDAVRQDVGVRVNERAPGRLGWGAGYNTRDGFGGFLELAHDNLGGMGRRASIRGQMTLEPGDVVPSQYLGMIGFREPRLRDSLWSFKTNLIGERTTRSVDQFNLEHISLVNSLDRPIGRRLGTGIELETDWSDVFDVADDAVLTPEDEGTSHTVALSPFLVYEGRDDPFAPRRGVFDSVRLRYSLPGISTMHFVKLSMHHSQYLPLYDNVIGLYALRAGWAMPLDGSYTVPITERFFLGGRSTVRGFSEDSIGPEGEKGNAQGGDLSLNTNIELRFPLLYSFGGAVFFDAGGVYLQERSMSSRDFRRGAGFGLRYMTPVGPLNLDYGIKLDRRGGEDFGSFHFSIGTAF